MTTFWLPDLIGTCDLNHLSSECHCESKYEIDFFSKKLGKADFRRLDQFLQIQLLIKS